MQLHTYCTKLSIEAKTLEEIVHSMVMPAVLRHQTELARNIAALKEIGMESAASYQKEALKTVSDCIIAINEGLTNLDAALEKAHHADGVRQEADLLCNEVKPQMDAIRAAVDTLEGIVDDQYWPLVKYRELLFVR